MRFWSREGMAGTLDVVQRAHLESCDDKLARIEA